MPSKIHLNGVENSICQGKNGEKGWARNGARLSSTGQYYSTYFRCGTEAERSRGACAVCSCGENVFPLPWEGEGLASRWTGHRPEIFEQFYQHRSLLDVTFARPVRELENIYWRKGAWRTHVPSGTWPSERHVGYTRNKL